MVDVCSHLQSHAPHATERHTRVRKVKRRPHLLHHNLVIRLDRRKSSTRKRTWKQFYVMLGTYRPFHPSAQLFHYVPAVVFPNGSTTTPAETPNYIFWSVGRERWRIRGVETHYYVFAIQNTDPECPGHSWTVGWVSFPSCAPLNLPLSVMEPEADANRNGSEKKWEEKRLKTPVMTKSIIR